MATNNKGEKKSQTYDESGTPTPIIRRPKTIHGFFDFIRGYGVIAIAVGLYLATSLKTVIDSITNNIINPLITLITGNVSFASRTACLNSVDGVCKTTLNYGAVINTIISFLIGAFILYLMVKSFRLDRFDKKKDS